MSMAFCRGCGNEIHESAVNCPSCGMSQDGQKSQTKVVYASYDQVPWYRKNWFIVVGFLVFAPATLYSLFTGDIYYQKKGQLVTYSKVAKIVALILCLMLSVSVIGKMLSMNKTRQAETISTVAIAAPALAPLVATQSDTAPSVPVVVEGAPSPLVSTIDPVVLCNGLNLDIDAEHAECLNRQFSVADKQLNDVYKQLAAVLDDTSKRALKTEQVAWIKEKESKCAQAGKEVEGGTLEPVVIADCKVQMTDQRIVYLKNYK